MEIRVELTGPECDGEFCNEYEHSPECILYDDDDEPRCDICLFPQTCGYEQCTICPGNWDEDEGVHNSCVGWL